jgi:hypothetical protein
MIIRKQIVRNSEKDYFIMLNKHIEKIIDNKRVERVYI